MYDHTSTYATLNTTTADYHPSLGRLKNARRINFDRSIMRQMNGDLFDRAVSITSMEIVPLRSRRLKGFLYSRHVKPLMRSQMTELPFQTSPVVDTIVWAKVG